MNSGERLLSVFEVAERLSLAPVTIRQWIGQRRIASVRLGRARRVPESEVSRIIELGLTPSLPERER